MKVLDTLSMVGALVMAATPLVGAASVAHAAEPGVPAVRVSVADLDFSRPADVKRFRARVERAGDAICAAHQAGGLVGHAACSDAILQEATEKLGSEQRSAMRVATASQHSAWQVAGR